MYKVSSKVSQFVTSDHNRKFKKVKETNKWEKIKKKNHFDKNIIFTNVSKILKIIYIRDRSLISQSRQCQSG